MNQTRGYLFLAFGEYYCRELYNLVLTLNKAGNTLPISVVCSRNDVDTLVKTNLYDEVLIFDFEHELYKEPGLTQFEALCLIPRLLFNHLVPYDQTIITDTDMLCQYNPQSVWDKVSTIDQPVVMTGVNYDPTWHFGYNHEVSAHLGKNVPASHGGFFFINRNHPKLDEYFKLSIEVYKKYDDYKLRRMFRGGRVDEPIFAVVNAMMGYPVLEFTEHPVITFNYKADRELPSKVQTIPFEKELDDYIPFIHMFKPHTENYSTLLQKLLS